MYMAMEKINKYWIYFIKGIKDNISPLIYKTNNDNNKKRLKEYYFLFDIKELKKGGSYLYRFDDKGIPLVKGHFVDYKGEWLYHPQAIGQYALALFNEYCKKDSNKIKEKFLILADWYINNYKTNQDIPYWEKSLKAKEIYVYDKDKSQIISSMSQSRAISVLLRAYQITNNEKYINLAQKAVQAYFKKDKDGGFLYKNEYGYFFEEPGKSGILNHNIFAIFGLYDFVRFSDFKKEYQDLFEKSLESIKNRLYKYDLGYWSAYDDYYIDGKRRINVCSRHYHFIHIKQLKVLYNISGIKKFKDYHNKWIKYDKSVINRFKMIWGKYRSIIDLGRI